MDRIARTLERGGRVLVAGAPGTGKSTFAAELGARCRDMQLEPLCLGCDPGSPAFGPPGAVSLGEWQPGEGWRLLDLEPVCTLDAARFRLPLVDAVARLLERARPCPLVLDAPGAVRGVAGAEMLSALAERARADLIVLLERRAEAAGLGQELAALAIPLMRLRAADAARSATKPARARMRTGLWDAYLARETTEAIVDLGALALIGMPPPRSVPAAWIGRQVALLRSRRWIGFGEILAADDRSARVRLRGRLDGADTLLVRDAQRSSSGLIGTSPPVDPARQGGAAGRPRPAGGAPARALPSAMDAAEETSSLTLHVGPFTATLVNGVFGDPLLLVRARQGGRVLLFDIGEATRLGAKDAHRVTDVFVSHAHIDHVGGFLWLLRARIGVFPACRLFGPPGLAANINGMVNGVHWDRAGEGAPRFEVVELDAEGRLRRFEIKAGQSDARPIEESRSDDGTLVDEPPLRVRAVMLDHRTPVLAYALQSAREIAVDKEALASFGAPAGPWLASLKHELGSGRLDAPIELPDGRVSSAGALAEKLVNVSEGTKLVYATDLADTAANRALLAALAQGADVMFCEATFREAHADKAERTGHLTTRACAEIASLANVSRLVPFHFSRRYEPDPDTVYRELRAAAAGPIVIRLRPITARPSDPQRHA